MTAPDAALPLKVCGLTRARDVLLCLELGVGFTGFIFAPRSPRRIRLEDAAAMPGGAAARVGVFAGQGAEEVLRTLDRARLDYAQLHGGEDEDFCRAVGPERVIKTLWPERLGARRGAQGTAAPFRLEDLEAECRRFAPVCAFFLLDAGQGGGGGGRALPWETLENFAPPRPWILAGGIGPDNLPRALAACSPWAVDCNSGVEEAPGLKDARKLLDAAALLRAPQTALCKGRSS
jgi:phosphoribosylanthranilate isomerase